MCSLDSYIQPFLQSCIIMCEYANKYRLLLTKEV